MFESLCAIFEKTRQALHTPPSFNVYPHINMFEMILLAGWTLYTRSSFSGHQIFTEGRMKSTPQREVSTVAFL